MKGILEQAYCQPISTLTAYDMILKMLSAIKMKFLFPRALLGEPLTHADSVRLTPLYGSYEQPFFSKGLKDVIVKVISNPKPSQKGD
jgi:hypothetical protein